VIRLSWKPGLGAALATTSTTGSFGTDLEIFPDDNNGPRTLLASLVPAGRQPAVATNPLATEAFLAQPGSAEPPFSKASAPTP
jgi:hypothetical protein